MTNNKPNDVRVVSVELLENIAAWLERSNQNSDEDIAECIQLRAILAQPADQQGEPFAWMCFDFEGGHDFTEDAERAERWRKSLGEKYKGCLTPLYRHAQPATAKVVLPGRMIVPDADCPERVNAQGWNACLDATAKLNGAAKVDERLTEATAFVQKLCDAARGRQSVATGYLNDILDVLQGRATR